MHVELREIYGFRIGRNRVARLMRQLGLVIGRCSKSAASSSTSASSRIAASAGLFTVGATVAQDLAHLFALLESGSYDVIIEIGQIGPGLQCPSQQFRDDGLVD